MEPTLSSVTLLTIIGGVLALALAYIAMWSGRKIFVRYAALLLSIAFIPLSWFAFNDLLSRPKHITLQEIHEKKMCLSILLPVYFKERVGIYMLIRSPQQEEPRYVIVAWDLKFAIKLQRAQNEANLLRRTRINYGGIQCQKGGKRIHATESTEEGSLMFYADPVPELPPKDLSPFYTTPPPQMPEHQ